MDTWEFLLQKQGTRNWLRLKSERLAIAPDVYRIAAQNCAPDIEVNLQIIHQTVDAGGQPKRRSQQRTCNTNPKGLMVVIPFTELTPGLWELQITTQSGAPMMQTLRLQVETPPEPPRPKTPPIASPETFAAAFAPPSSPDPDQPAAPSDFDSETAHGLLEQSISSLEHILAQVSEPPPYIDPPPVAQPVAVAPASTETIFPDDPEAIAPSPAPSDLHRIQLTIALLEDSFVRRRDEPILISGHVNCLNPHQPNPLDQGFDGVLRYELRDPQSFDLLLNVEQPLSDATIPLVFNYLLDVPTAYATRLILGEVILEVFTEQQGRMLPSKLTSQSFSITASLEELLDTVTQVPLPEPEPIPNIQLPPTQSVDFGDLWASPGQTAEQASALPPRLNRSPSQRRKPLDLPSFGNPPPQQPPLERGRWDDNPQHKQPPQTPALTSHPEPEPPPSIFSLLSEDEGPPPPLTTTEEDWLGLTFWPEPSEPIPAIAAPAPSSLDPSEPGTFAEVNPPLDVLEGEEPRPGDSEREAMINDGEAWEAGPLPEAEPNDPEANGWLTAVDDADQSVDAAFAQLPLQDRFWQQINDFAQEGRNLGLDPEAMDDGQGMDEAQASAQFSPWVDLGEGLEAEFTATPPGELAPEADLEPEAEPTPPPHWGAVEQALSAIADGTSMAGNTTTWDRGDWPIQEFVVDEEEEELPPPSPKGMMQRQKGYDTSGLPYPKELWQTAQTPGKAPPVFQEPTAVAAPILGVQGGELTAGEMILVKIKLPPQEGTFYVKLWVQDRETRQLLDGPRSFIEFTPNGAGELETMTQLIVPLGTQSVRFEAVTINVTTQQESHKTQCDRTVIPPNLQAFNDSELF